MDNMYVKYLPYEEPATNAPAAKKPETRKLDTDPAMEDVGEEYLAEAVVRLIENNRDVQHAMLNFVCSCPRS